MMLFRGAILSLVWTTLLVFSGAANADHDALKGKHYFKRCAPCHNLTNGAHKSGPSLKDVIGRRAGTAKGFRYSKDLKAAGVKGLVWDHDTVHDFLGDPKRFLAKFLGKRRIRSKMKLRYPNDEFRHGVVTVIENNGKKH